MLVLVAKYHFSSFRIDLSLSMGPWVWRAHEPLLHGASLAPECLGGMNTSCLMRRQIGGD